MHDASNKNNITEQRIIYIYNMKKFVYSMTHSTHFIYGNIASERYLLTSNLFTNNQTLLKLKIASFFMCLLVVIFA